MLAETTFISAKNDADQAVTVSAVLHPWKFGTDGALSYRGAQTAQTCAPDSGGTDVSLGHDNSSNLDLGGHYLISITSGGNTSGTVTIYMHTDANDSEQTVALVSTTFTNAASETKKFGVEI